MLIQLSSKKEAFNMKITYPGSDTLYTYQSNRYASAVDATLHSAAFAYEYQHKGEATPKSDEDTIKYLMESFGYEYETATNALGHMSRLSIATLEEMLKHDIFYVISYGYGVVYPFIFHDLDRAIACYSDEKSNGRDVMLTAVYANMEGF